MVHKKLNIMRKSNNEIDSLYAIGTTSHLEFNFYGMENNLYLLLKKK